MNALGWVLIVGLLCFVVPGVADAVAPPSPRLDASSWYPCDPYCSSAWSFASLAAAVGARGP
jgi:hypothetical protein